MRGAFGTAVILSLVAIAPTVTAQDPTSLLHTIYGLPEEAARAVSGVLASAEPLLANLDPVEELAEEFAPVQIDACRRYLQEFVLGFLSLNDQPFRLAHLSPCLPTTKNSSPQPSGAPPSLLPALPFPASDPVGGSATKGARLGVPLDWPSLSAQSTRPATTNPPHLDGLWLVTLILLGLAVLALYRRLSKRALLNHPTRAAIIQLVRERPGLTAAQIAKALVVHYKTTRHHLDLLLEAGSVKAQRFGRMVHYYPPEGPWGVVERRLVSAANLPGRGRVLSLLQAGALSVGDVAGRLGLSLPTASIHLSRLERDGLLVRRREGSRVIYALAPSTAAVVARVL